MDFGQHDGVEVGVATITPEIAKDMLSRVPDYQRTVRNDAVKAYAADMRNGNWSDAVAGSIVIAKDGSVLDGQHRLLAVMESNTTHVFTAVTGVDSDDFKRIDVGRNRSVSDNLSCKNSAHIATYGKVNMGWDTGTSVRTCIGGNSRWSKPQTVDYCNANMDELQEIDSVYNKLRGSFGRFPLVVAALFWHIAGIIDEDAREVFVNDLVSHNNSRSGQAARTCDAITRDYVMGTHTKARCMGYMLRGFEMFLAGTPCKRVRFDDSILDRYGKEVLSIG